MAKHAVLDVTATATPSPPRLADGVELVGEYHGSGYVEPKFLVNRPDGQVIQLPRALYVLATTLDGHRNADEIAVALGDELDREIAPDQVTHLIETKLRPAGIAAHDPDSADPAAPATVSQPDPLLMLRFRLPVVPTEIVWRIAGVFAPAFRPVVLAVVLAAFLVVDVAIVAGGGIGALVPSTLALVEAPAMALLVIGTLLASGLFHECGHVGACRYGGARPGAMGVGIYLVWPAFYSTVTDSYRLSRAGRLRTDLGGVYFNAAFLTAIGTAYLATGAPWLLIAIVALHVETVRQFLPSIRFDGYYILSDLIGLPDLFMFLRPVLTSVLPGRPRHPRVAELRPRVRRIIVAWVLLVVPLLLGFLVLFVVMAPQVLPVIWATFLGQLATLAAAVRTGDSAVAVLNATQGLFLLLPVLGVSLLLAMIGRRMFGWLRTTPRARPARGRPQPLANLAVVAVPIVLLGLLALAGLDQRVATAGEARTAAAAAAVTTTAPAVPTAGAEVVAVHQIAAFDALLGGLGQGGVLDGARAVLLLAGVLGALLLWPVARGLGMPGPVSALVVALGALPALLPALFGAVEPGGLAALWLVAAAALVGRGRGPNTAAVLAVAMGVLTAPVAAVGLLAFGAHGVATGQLAAGWRRGAARVVAAVLGLGAAAVAVRTVPFGARSDSTVGWPLLLTVLIVGGVLVAAAEYRSASIRPIATAAGALLLCAAVPGPRTGSAVLLALPILAVLAGMLAYSYTEVPRPRPGARRALLAAVLIASLLAAGPLVAAAAAPEADRQRLGAWVLAELDPTTTLQVDPITAAQLVADGVPADRLVAIGDPAGAVTAGPAGPPGSATGNLLVEMPGGPGGGAVSVYGAQSDPGPSLGPLLADNPRLTLSPRAEQALRDDRVDSRLATALAGLTGVYDLTVEAFPGVPGEPDGAPGRTALITAVDGVPVQQPAAAELVQRWLAGQQPPYRPADVEIGPNGLTVHYTVSTTTSRRPS